MSNPDKSAALTMIGTINAVEGFDPTPLVEEYLDLVSGEKRKRLPVMSQVAWFRLKYPEGRFTINVTPGKDCFVASVRVYKNYMDPVDCFLSEASASRGYLSDKPTVSPREWAKTAALGIALRNAGFGLQFHAAGESFDEPAVNELGQLIETPPMPVPDMDHIFAPHKSESGESDDPSQTEAPAPPASAMDPLGAAMKMPCPTAKYKGKTLGDMVSIDPGYLVWVANKFQDKPEVSQAAKLICEQALAVSA